MTLSRKIELAAASVNAFFLFGCVSLPPDPVTASTYAQIAGGMTKDQVFAILGPGTQQSETTMGGITLETYSWTPRDNPYARVTVSFNNGYEMTKIKIGL